MLEFADEGVGECCFARPGRAGDGDVGEGADSS